ncbi:vesicle-associated membrane protein 3 [Hemicordylus capensis]|uniref:vesicle-associated membrane protein 3 n=1 Tax=Hemicordylus capensis TaxID=884348 RepID=UPI002304BDF6|nr:vesicle-associated membrane protein 3 [Hemicordylus capensis]
MAPRHHRHVTRPAPPESGRLLHRSDTDPTRRVRLSNRDGSPREEKLTSETGSQLTDPDLLMPPSNRERKQLHRLQRQDYCPAGRTCGTPGDLLLGGRAAGHPLPSPAPSPAAPGAGTRGRGEAAAWGTAACQRGAASVLVDRPGSPRGEAQAPGGAKRRRRRPLCASPACPRLPPAPSPSSLPRRPPPPRVGLAGAAPPRPRRARKKPPPQQDRAAQFPLGLAWSSAAASMSTSGPAGAAPGSNRRLQQTQHQVDEVVDIMRVNVDKVLERDQKLSELDDRADALQAGAAQFETSAAKLKRKYWWKNCKMWAILIAVVVVLLIIIIVWSVSS